MIYEISEEYDSIDESTGTLQNTSLIHTIEVANKPDADNGILLYPRQKIVFSELSLWVRCLDGTAYVRVIPYKLKPGTGADVARALGSEPEEPEEPATPVYAVAQDSEISEMLKDIFGTEK